MLPKIYKLFLLAFFGLLLTVSQAYAIGRFAPTTSLAGRDATNKFFNPAALSSLESQEAVIQAFTYYDRRLFKGSVTSFNALRQPQTVNGSVVTYGITNIGNVTTIPAFYYALPVTKKFFASLIVVPYPTLGLEYPQDSILRYDATKAFENSVDIALSVGFKITDQLSAGIGLDADYLSEHLKVKVNTRPITAADSSLIFDVRSWAFGWHGGLYYIPRRGTWLGLAYHSAITATMRGSSSFTPGSPSRRVLPSSVANTRLTLPFAGYATFTIHQMFSRLFGLIASIEYREWNIYDKDRAYNVASPTGPVTNISFKGLHDQWHFSLTGHYSMTDQAALFLGIGHANSPAHARNRTVLSTYPATDEVLAGLHYQATKKIVVDAALVHVFRNTSNINKASQSGGTNVVGKMVEDTDVFFIQMIYDFL